jgi:hypothetical protein
MAGKNDEVVPYNVAHYKIPTKESKYSSSWFYLTDTLANVVNI